MPGSRSNVVSSFTVIKGPLIDETYAAFRAWDFDLSRTGNLARIRDQNLVGAASTNWLRDVTKVLNRRFDPDGRDRPLVLLAKAGAEPDLWRSALLWHMTRDEFLVRDFFVNWLYPRFIGGTFRLRTDDVLPYLADLHGAGVEVAEQWSPITTQRVAAGLLRIAVDFGLMTGSVVREFASFHLTDDALLYVLQAMAAGEPNAQRLMALPDWHLYLMDSGDVEREILRLHQFRRLDYQVAGSLTQLSLPYPSLTAFVEGLAT